MSQLLIEYDPFAGGANESDTALGEYGSPIASEELEYNNDDLGPAYYSSVDENGVLLRIRPPEFFQGMVQYAHRVENNFDMMKRRYTWLARVTQEQYQHAISLGQDAVNQMFQFYSEVFHHSQAALAAAASASHETAVLRADTMYEVSQLQAVTSDLTQMASALRNETGLLRNQTEVEFISVRQALARGEQSRQREVASLAESVARTENNAQQAEQLLNSAISELRAGVQEVRTSQLEASPRGREFASNAVNRARQDIEANVRDHYDALGREIKKAHQEYRQEIERKFTSLRSELQQVIEANAHRDEEYRALRKFTSEINNRCEEIDAHWRERCGDLEKVSRVLDGAVRNMTTKIRSMDREMLHIKQRLNIAEHEISRSPVPPFPGGAADGHNRSLSTISAISFGVAPNANIQPAHHGPLNYRQLSNQSTGSAALESMAAAKLLNDELRSEGYMRTKKAYAACKFTDPQVLRVLQSDKMCEYGFPANQGHFSVIMSEFVQLLKDLVREVNSTRVELRKAIETRLKDLHEIHGTKKEKCFVTPGQVAGFLEHAPEWQLAEALVCLKMDTGIKFRDTNLDVQKTRIFFHRIFMRARINTERSVTEPVFLDQVQGLTHVTDEAGKKISIDSVLDF